ncbi:MAG: hypothetical protein PHT31_05470 [Candidatus Omnitrophica bacterium]|nr:hypothetical protein [Candidatus Omnitrophota bacterium]MDD5653589.1 hypothetical protein [Candidatus Omnitrophota bacterium]
MLRKLRKAQATLEYVLILTALVGAFVALKGVVANKMQTGFTEVTNNAADIMGKLTFK